MAPGRALAGRARGPISCAESLPCHGLMIYIRGSSIDLTALWGARACTKHQFVHFAFVFLFGQIVYEKRYSFDIAGIWFFGNMAEKV